MLEAVLGDLLEESVDAICSEANGGLSPDGGVAALISEAAGPALDHECDQIVRARGRVPIGDAVVTTAGRLHLKGVIHVVGPPRSDEHHPRFGGTEARREDEDKLVQALKAAFVAADERGWTSVSFPAVAAGSFGVPDPVCARAYVSAAGEFFAERPDSSVKTLRLVLFHGPTEETGAMLDAPLVKAVRAEMDGSSVLYCHFNGDEPWPRSVIRLLWARYPEVEEAFRRAGIFVIEFEVGADELDSHDSLPRELAESSAREAYRACRACPGAGTLLFLAHTNGGSFEDLAAGGLTLPDGLFLGACGYVEGGLHMCGTDGTFIKSDDWNGARDYALRVARRYERPES